MLIYKVSYLSNDNVEYNEYYSSFELATIKKNELNHIYESAKEAGFYYNNNLITNIHSISEIETINVIDDINDYYN